MLGRTSGIFEVEFHSNQKGIGEVRIFLIPGKDGKRDLVVDVGFRSRMCLYIMREALEKLGIAYNRLDIFLTHRRHDHCGLADEYAARGTRLLMNSQEDRHCYDCLYRGHSHGSLEDQPQVPQNTGVTEEGTPEIWNMFMEMNQRIRENRGWGFETPECPYTPANKGQVLGYGGYDLETVGFKGHTCGQMGLYGRNHKVPLCADQTIDDIVSIMGITYPDEHLLRGCFDSLGRLKHQYRDCLILPTHKEPIRDVERVMDRTAFAYLGRTDLTKHILDYGHHGITTKEVACLAYGIDHMSRSQSEFIKLKMVVSKTFSCSKYLYDEDFAICTLEGGDYHWEAP